MALFLRPHERRKDGKVHTYWSLVENRRAGDGRVVQRQVLYLGALSPIQELSWEKTAQQFDPPPTQPEALNGLASEENCWPKRPPPSPCIWINFASSGHGNGAPVGWRS